MAVTSVSCFFLVERVSMLKMLAELLSVIASIVFFVSCIVLRKIRTSWKVVAKPVVAPKKLTIV